MNLFRLIGDLSHLLAILLLLAKIWKSRSCAGETRGGCAVIEISGSRPSLNPGTLKRIAGSVRCRLPLSPPLSSPPPAGISGKSQVLFGIVFVTRYLDLATNFVSMYNTVMKVVFILALVATCYLIFFKFRATYDANHDTFRAEFLVIPTAGLAVLVNHEFSLLEVGPRCMGS